MEPKTYRKHVVLKFVKLFGPVCGSFELQERDAQKAAGPVG